MGLERLILLAGLCFVDALVPTDQRPKSSVGKMTAREFEELDSQLLVTADVEGRSQKLAMAEDDVPIWKEEGYEPYSDDLDSHVTINGMPDAWDEDSSRHHQYESWLQNYKRIPNVPKQLWSYDNEDTAPDVWASLDKDYMFCDPDLAKTSSSPIDIQSSMARQSCYGPSFEVQTSPSWDSTPASLSELFDRSFVVDVANCRPGEGCKSGPLVPKSANYDDMILERIIFHTPSEHKLNGETMDMELQFMHCKASGRALVAGCRPEMGIAVLLKDGGTSQNDPAFLTQLAMTVKDVGPDPRELVKGLQFQSVAEVIAPLLNRFYMYWGSTTYPPCYQRVQWYVPDQVIKVSSSIVAAFKAREGENVRPAFSLGTRPLLFMIPERADHWTYRGPRGSNHWGSPRFPWLAYTSCGRAEDCEQLPDQAGRDKCLAEQKMQSPIDIFTNECQPNVDWGKPCVAQVGLRPLHWNLGGSMSEALKIYLKDCNACKPCNNKFNAYTLTLVAPGVPKPVSLAPGAGGCSTTESCKSATGYAAPTLTYENSIYGLREVVIHTPSEHTVDGVPAAAEVQLISDLVDCVKCTCPGWGSAGYVGGQWCCCSPNNNDKTVLVQSLLLTRGRAGAGPSWVSAVASAAKSATGEPLALVPDLYFRDIAGSIHAIMSTYYLYDGSLTAPPCSGSVQWLVIKRALEVSDADMDALAALSVGGNARPVRSLNGRSLSVAGTVQL